MPERKVLHLEGAGERAEFWRARGIDGVDFFRAAFRTHRYSRHTHDTYAIGVVEDGVYTFGCRGSSHIAPPSDIIIVNPDEAHDGHALSASGALYCMIYVEPEVFAQAVAELTGHPARLPFFARSVVHDPQTARALLRLHRASRSGGILERDTRLLEVFAALARRHSDDRVLPANAAYSPTVRRLCDFLRAHLDRDPTLATLARVAGLSRFHVLRLFRREVGLPPHAYLTQLRLNEARRRLRRSEPAASVAAAVGFADQSHLIKRFRLAYGITPGQYAAPAR